jgi:hypothetical protein
MRMADRLISESARRMRNSAANALMGFRGSRLIGFELFAPAYALGAGLINSCRRVPSRQQSVCGRRLMQAPGDRAVG